jgi:hypothetical protein
VQVCKNSLVQVLLLLQAPVIEHSSLQALAATTVQVLRMDHGDQMALPRASSMPPARGVSGSECPPRPSQPLTTKPRRRQAFIVPGPIPGQQAACPGGISRQLATVARPSDVVTGRLAQPPPGPNFTAAATKVSPSHVLLPIQDSLPLWHTHGSVSTTTATKAPPPCSHIEELQAHQAHLP